MISLWLIKNIHEIIEANEGIDLFTTNKYGRGLTHHIQTWGGKSRRMDKLSDW